MEVPSRRGNSEAIIPALWAKENYLQLRACMVSRLSPVASFLGRANIRGLIFDIADIAEFPGGSLDVVLERAGACMARLCCFLSVGCSPVFRPRLLAPRPRFSMLHFRRSIQVL